MKGRKTGGRTKGTPNKATREAKEFCASIFNDPEYQDNLRRRAVDRKLGNPNRSYDVSPDGQRFLMIKAASADPTTAPPQHHRRLPP